MILFLDDWKKYPSAIADTRTTNKSFLRLASVYKMMGIKNHMFLLALVNPSLQGVDPFDPNLTLKQMGEIAIECSINPWYFFRECARAPADSGMEAVPLEANRANIALFWSFFNHALFILIQPRQTGKSFSTDVLMSLLMNVICKNTKINLLTKDDNLRRRNIERLKEIMTELPRYLQMRTAKDSNNGEEVTVSALENTYSTHVPQSSPKRAYSMGRGLTTAIIHVDEPPFQPNIAIALPAAMAATGAAVESAKAAGAPYGTILTTTAGKKDDRDGRFVYNLMSGAAEWDEKFLDTRDAVEFEKFVRRNSRSGSFHINGTFSHRQLGKTDAWLRGKIEAALQEGQDADRDFFNIWTSGSQSSPLPKESMEMIAASIRPHDYTDISIPDSYITRWYIPQNEIGERLATGKFVMSLDTSEAGGGDDIALTIMDVETLKLIAIGNYNETNLITFSKWICSILVNNPNITAIIERRSTGAMVLDYLMLMLPQAGIDPFRRLFNRVVNDSDEFPDRFKEINVPMSRRPEDIYVRYKKSFGFATSGTGQGSRSELYSTTLQNAAKRAGDRIYDKSLTNQILGLVVRNGRVDHEVGEHDDLVIAWLLSHWLLTLGKNLTFYGIDIKRVMTQLADRERETDYQFVQRVEQEEIRHQIDATYKELALETDEYVCMRLEQQLRLLDRKIILESGEIYSVDQLIKSARESKRGRRWGNGGNNSGMAGGRPLMGQAMSFTSDTPYAAYEMLRPY